MTFLKTFHHTIKPALLLGTTAITLLCTQARADNKALALGWQGYADTDLKFSEFMNADHTITVRFMAQYPNGYEGPLIGENGTGGFFLGQADYRATGNLQPKIMVGVADFIKVYEVSLKPGTWHHLALVTRVSGDYRTYIVYLDGSFLYKDFTLWDVDKKAVPTGTMRIGRRTTGQTINGREAQFYGLIDDVAVFNRALSDEEIQKMAANAPQLTGNESGLLAGYTFDGGSLPAKLSRPVTLHDWNAKSVAVSANRSSADVSAIPLHFNSVELTLPFKPGEAWKVVQAPDTPFERVDGKLVNSHNGYAEFAWDFDLFGLDANTLYPYGSMYAPFYAAGRGDVAFLWQSSVEGPNNAQNTNPANIIDVMQGPAEYGEYLHFPHDSSLVGMGNFVKRGLTQLSIVGNTGTGTTPVDGYHLHFGVTRHVAYTGGQITLPGAFSNYDQRNGDGTWHRVLRGSPKTADVIRVPQEPNYRYVAVWRDENSDPLHDEHTEFVNPEDFKNVYDSAYARGWRLQNLSVANNIGTFQYTATWRPGTILETAIFGKTYPEYKQNYDILSAQGWRLHKLVSYVHLGMVYYTAVWRKEQADELPVLGVPYSVYRNNYDVLWNSGWRLHILQSFVLNGQVLYNAVFRQTGGGSETQSYGVTLSALTDRNNTLKAQGWRLSIVQGYLFNGAVLYNAVWVPGSLDDYSVFAATYDEFRAQCDSRRAMGWRLYKLDFYHP